MRIQQSFLIIALLSIVGVAACLLFLQPFPLLHDYPEWMYQGWIVQQLLSGTPTVEARYTLVTYPVPNSLSQIVVGLLSMIVSPVLAAKIWLGVYFLGAVALCLVVYRRNRDAAQVLLLTAIVIFGPGFWNGYVNFQFALLLFGVYLLLSTAVQKNFAVTLLWSLLIFFAHAAVFVAFVAFSVAVTWFDKRNVPSAKPALSYLALLPSLILLGWYTLVRLSGYSGDGAGSMGLSEWLQYKSYTLAKQGPFHNFILPNGESLLEHADWFYKIGFASNFVFAVLLILWFVWLLWTWLIARKSPLAAGNSVPLGAIVLCILVCIVAYMSAGSNTFGVVNLGERFLIAALLVALLNFVNLFWLKNLMAVIASVFTLYVAGAIVYLSTQTLEQYAVARSSATSDLSEYVDDIYASTRHQYFNHRLFIYADRGIELLKPAPGLLEIDLDTSVVRHVR